MSLSSGGTHTGRATVSNTPGSHGNLGTSSIQVAESAEIPTDIGFGDDLPAYFGVVAITMAWRHVTDSAAEAGHATLNEYVEDAISEVVGRIGPAHREITQEASVTAGAGGGGGDTVRNAQS